MKIMKIFKQIAKLTFSRCEKSRKWFWPDISGTQNWGIKLNLDETSTTHTDAENGPKIGATSSKNFPKKLNVLFAISGNKNLIILNSKLFFYKIVNPRFWLLPPSIIRPRLTRIPNTRAPHSTTPTPQEQNWQRNNNKARQLTHRNRAGSTTAPQQR